MPWIGGIPEGWAVEPFRRLFRESKEVNGPTPVGPMLSISGYRGVEEKVYESESLIRDNDQLETYRVVRPGQLAVNTMWLNYAGLGVSELLGHVSPAYRAYWISERLDSKYAHHLMRSAIYVQGYTALLTGIRPNSLQMSRADLMAFPVLVPPLEEQRAIADYLDRETAQIDAFIAKNEELITLLTERRSALLTRELFQASTERVRLKHLGRIRYGIGEPPPYVDEGVPLIRATNVNAGKVDARGLVFVDPADIPSSRIVWLREGDIVVVRSGALTGDSTIISAEYAGSIAGFDMVFRPHDPRLAQVVGYSLLAREVKEAQIDGLSARAAQPHLNAQELGDVEVPLFTPSRAECIAARISRAWTDTEAAILAARHAVVLARERRAALISAAVTGKIDVGVVA
ncbi:hypothetical protein G5T42_11675 [Microbacterium sp. 4R-513]|uniref:hypothetical protein n=1 Tax=Microbacterium sp. 4R-513 TaxID=2567934 RepID=UPI0013E1A863|nr:hypothetical protein [Microbacterium sp. 4R-513]QIG40058.1 hypothetical protein G5T42_11675 [Microbacterium sp. 4R-513]